MRRVFALFGVIFLALPVLCEENALPETKSDNMKPFEARDNSLKPGQFNWPAKPKRFRYYLLPDNEVCYTMHSLLVVREPGSDSTQIVGQRTCTPSAQFQMKHSVQQPK